MIQYADNMKTCKKQLPRIILSSYHRDENKILNEYFMFTALVELVCHAQMLLTFLSVSS